VIQTILEFAPLLSSLAAVGAVLMSFRNSLKIKEVHISINSRMDQLLAATQLAAEAKGADEERSKRLPDDREGNGLLNGLKR
jgi:hypothetical protein